jgi:hypothetical protein
MTAVEERSGAEPEVGRARKRKEDLRLITGRTRWTDNITLPGMLHLAFVRSPFASARITSIDTEAARSSSGVAAVFTGADLGIGETGLPNAWPITGDQKTPHHPAMPTERVAFAGEAVAVVVATDGASATDGAYVIYPLQDLLAQVALHSQRARCLVVGEDLGTVPEGMSAALAACNVLSYSVLWFERRDGRLRPPPEWRRLAAACVSTHDLPTLAGWWDGADITEKHGLGLLDDAAADQARAARAAEKADLVAQLQQEALLEEDVDIRGAMPAAVARAVHAFVSATLALLALIQADDLAGELEAVNLPGTDRERPNWRRRLDPDVEELCRTPLARAILSALKARRQVRGSR